MWLYLLKDLRPPASYAQWASSTVLRETYLTFALWTSAIAIAMWVLALGFILLGTIRASFWALTGPRSRR